MSFEFLGFADVNGALRGKSYDAGAFEAVLHRGHVASPDVLLAGDPLDQPITTLTSIGVRSGSGDLRLEPVPGTRRPVPWRPGSHLSLGDLSWSDGTPCPLSSRQVLRAALARSSAAGLRAVVAFEYEVRLWRLEDGSPATIAQSYSARGVEQLAQFADRLQSAAADLELGLTVVHTEGGPGLVEINVDATDAQRAADNAVVLRHAVHEVARQSGYLASFLAKPRIGEEGSSGHVHVSLWADDHNIMGVTADGGLNDATRHAVGGLLRHLPAMSLVMNPNINSYKRLVPGYFAPTNVSWGVDNRSAAVRTISNDPANARLEVRRPGADSNPYLVLAAVISGMLEGLQNSIEPPPPTRGDASAEMDQPLDALPGSLESAIAAFTADDRFRELLGHEFSDYFVITREWELSQWQQTVTDWELHRYGLIT